MIPIPEILFVRDHRVMLDRDLALLYGVSAARLGQQVRRQMARFPADFGFPLLLKEVQTLHPHLSPRGRRYMPWVFTEQGALMLANVLSGPTAVDASIRLVRFCSRRFKAPFDAFRQTLGRHDR